MRSSQPGDALLGYWMRAKMLVYSWYTSPSIRKQLGKIWIQLGAIQSEICSRLGTMCPRAGGLACFFDSKDVNGSKKVNVCFCSLACCLCRECSRSSIIFSCSATLDSASKEER